MPEVAGKVVAIDGEHALVAIRETGCGRCHELGGCGSHGLNEVFCSSPTRYRVLNPRSAGIGDHVVVVVPEKAVFSSALIAYVLPLAGLFCGAAGGFLVAGNVGSIAGAFSGVLLSWTILYLSGIGDKAVDADSQPLIK